jgi:diguanylate cyclase (GGDEF)-like protein
MIFEQHGQFVALLQLQHDVQQKAATDPLTGLANRRELADRLDAQMLMPGNDGPASFALAILDLDGFKTVNDNYGHRVGDQLLQSVAERLQAACGNAALAARIGGDEFAILFAPDSSLPPRQHINHVLASLIEPHRVAGHVLHIGASTGMAHWPDDGATMAQLFDAADANLYAAKSRLPHSRQRRRA